MLLTDCYRCLIYISMVISPDRDKFGVALRGAVPKFRDVFKGGYRFNPHPRNYDEKNLICPSVSVFHISMVVQCRSVYANFCQLSNEKSSQNGCCQCLILCSKFTEIVCWPCLAQTHSRPHSWIIWEGKREDGWEGRERDGGRGEVSPQMMILASALKSTNLMCFSVNCSTTAENLWLNENLSLYR